MSVLVHILRASVLAVLMPPNSWMINERDEQGRERITGVMKGSLMALMFVRARPLLARVTCVFYVCMCVYVC